MIRREKEEIIFYSWPSLDRIGVNAFTAAGLNTALHAPGQKSQDEILKNRRHLSRVVNKNPEDWICAQQLHTSCIASVTAADRGRGALSAHKAIKETDALILTEPGLNAMIFTADCLPLILYDKVQKIGALVHAGWRGAARGIVTNVLETMLKDKGCAVDNIMALTGPAIQDCCYQVDYPVYKSMTAFFPETQAAFTYDGVNHWRLNLEAAVFLQLQNRGINKELCEKSGLCTCCETELSSWRREGKEAGRMATCLCL